MPDRFLYEVFFNNMAVLDQVADREEQAGNHEQAMGWRTYDQRLAGLNDAEGQILKEVEVDCMRAVHEQDKKFQAAARKFRLATGGGITAPIPPELFQMNDERYAIIQRQIDQLRVALGESSFQKLDRYVHAVFAPHNQARPKPKSTPQAGSR
jgi:hypothetical protein